jgi:hypothetical protein
MIFLLTDDLQKDDSDEDRFIWNDVIQDQQSQEAWGMPWSD